MPSCAHEGKVEREHCSILTQRWRGLAREERVRVWALFAIGEVVDVYTIG